MALSRHHAAFNKPLSVQEIVSQAVDFVFTTNRPLQQWIRTGKLLLTEAAICEEEGNIQMAYLYLYRHAQLVLDRLPQHPDCKNPKYREDLAQARKAVGRNLRKLEEWKPRIQQQHERYSKAMERRNSERQKVQQQQQQVQSSRSSPSSKRQSVESADGTFGQETKPLLANEQRELAVDLAHREIRRRDATRRSTRHEETPSGTVPYRQMGVPLDPSDRSELINGQMQHDAVRAVGRQLYRADSGQYSRDPRVMAARPPETQSYHYPTVPLREDRIDWRMPAVRPPPSPTRVDPPPQRPAKEALDSHIPAVPPKSPFAPIPRPANVTPSPPPPAHAASPTSKYTFKPTSSTESGAPLRPVLLPPEMRTTFLNLAHPNTLRNLETCGILCGTLISNALFLTHLIIPEQTSTSDTCDTTEEGDNALFNYCDAHELLVCGWIHTHPTQSCFLSSRDLHTSSGYQVMLPEAISIVCAPRHNPDWGIFRLTDPPGLQTVLECRKQGLFHPHDERNIYTDALRPGHVVEGPGLKFEVVDLRNQ